MTPPAEDAAPRTATGAGDVEFLFLFAPNNSGTTVLSQYLAQQTGGYLPPFGNNEGQFDPEVRAEMRRRPWAPDRQMDWPRIRAAWAGRAAAEGRHLFIEASPPNLVRMDAILRAFAPCRAVVAIGAPQVQIASEIYNYANGPVTRAKLQRATASWIFKAERLRAGLEAHPEVPRITYAEFCAEPARLNRALGLPLRPAEAIRGKGRQAVRQITDLSARTVAFLDTAEIDLVAEMLDEAADLIAWFGIERLSGREWIARAAADPAQYHAALMRRIKWEAAGRRNRAAE